MTTAAQVLAKAESHLGYKETPAGSNDTTFGAWYGLNGQPWCAMFVSYAEHEAGVSGFAIQTVKGFSYCPALENWARARGLWMASASAKPGDAILYDFDGSGVAEHVELLVTQGTLMKTIGGNTTPDGQTGSQANGGEVCYKSRDHGPHTRGAVNLQHFYTVAPAPVATWQSDNGTYGHPTISQGAVSEPVGHAQRKLYAHGVNVSIDNVFGPATKLAVEKFQAYHHLTADGTVGPYTWQALHS